MGWRYLLFTQGAICVIVFVLRFVVFRFQESPKFLLYRGYDEKAVRVLRHIADFNRRETSISMEVFAALTDEDSSMGSGETTSPMIDGGPKLINATISQKINTEFSRYKILFATSVMARLTILIWITYSFDYWGFSIAGTVTMQKNGTGSFLR